MNIGSEASAAGGCLDPACGSLFDLVDDAIFVHDAETGAVLGVNAAGEKMYEASREAICAAGVETLSLGEPPYTAREALAHIRAAAAGTPQRFEWRARTMTGRLFWVEVTLKCVAGRSCDRLFSVVRDITERKRAEAELRKSEERFRLLAEAMPQIVCVLRPDGSVEYVSPTWVELSGMDLAATKAAGWSGILHPHDLPTAHECRLRTLRSMRPQEIELRYRTADGSYRWFLSRLAPVIEGGRVVRLVGAAMDVHARRESEEALRASEEKHRALFENLPDAVLMTIPGGRIVAANPAACVMFGMTEEELRRGGRAALADPGDPRHAAFAEERARAGRAANWELTYVRKSGERFPAETSSVVLGGGHSAFVVLREITDRKRAEEALRDANERLRDTDRRKDEFLGMLSHELRNPLAPIRTALYLLDHAPPDGQQARRAKEVANRQLAHLTRLVDDLLDVTRIARGKIELRRDDVDLAALARRTAEDHRAIMQDRRLDLDVQVPDEPVVVNADETRLAQVLGNLLHNAAKFTPAGGRVTLAVAREDGKAAIRVRDTGPGIAPDVLPTIFEPFTQAKQTLARTEGGLGLGLALVKGLVALHDGEVRAHSAGQGYGTEFVVTLPRATAPPARRRAPAPGRRARGRPCRILVVDDNRDAAETLAELVEMLGHQAAVAYDAPEALEKASQAPFDLALCDIGLPGMDGYELAQRLRALPAKRRMRLVALSGYAQPEDVARALEAGFDAHVAKPPDPEQLARLVEEAPSPPAR